MHNIFKLYDHWTCWLWIGIILFAALHESLGLVRWHGAIPLTWVIRDTIPEWLRWMLLGWLLYHFGIVSDAQVSK